jgi:hypothetical protein
MLTSRVETRRQSASMPAAVLTAVIVPWTRLPSLPINHHRHHREDGSPLRESSSDFQQSSALHHSASRPPPDIPTGLHLLHPGGDQCAIYFIHPWNCRSTSTAMTIKVTNTPTSRHGGTRGHIRGEYCFPMARSSI